MSGCGSCSSASAAIIANSSSLYNNLPGHYHGNLTTLLSALEKVDMRMRMEKYTATWRPNNFQSRVTPYRQAPRGTEVIAKATPLFFENNDEFAMDFIPPSVEGGICAETTLCAAPEANKVPGNSYQRFTWSMKRTAFELPQFCLKDLAFYENGFEQLGAYLANAEQIPSMFYDNYIRNYLWEAGEKYALAATNYGLLWNTPARVTERAAPNFLDFIASAPNGTGDIGTLKLSGFAVLKYLVEDIIGDASDLRVQGKSNVFMVGTEEDIYSFIQHDDDAGVVPYIQGGQGFHLFDLAVTNKLPFTFRTDKKWFRGDFDAITGEFVRVPPKIYVNENGGTTLRTNPDWVTAKYGVLSFMTANPFYFRQFEQFPSVPSQVPPETVRFLRPSFQWVPLMEKCNYQRGIVSWFTEEEFGLQPTGEKWLHVIYRRDELSSYIREARVGQAIELITPLRHEVPDTCGVPQVLTCCPAPGPVIDYVDYRDTSYTVTYNGNIDGHFGIDVADLSEGPIAASFATLKGTFDVIITGINSAGNLITFSVDPEQHSGGHFCCEDQLLGFVDVDEAYDGECHLTIDNGLRPDPYNHLLFHAALVGKLNVTDGDDVTVWFDNGCGVASSAVFVVESIDTTKNRLVLTVTPTDFPNGVPCADAVSICAHETEGCEDCATIPSAEACTEDEDLQPIP